MLQTQIFTQKYRSWLRFYSEFLRKNLAAEVSGLAKCLIKLNLRNVQEYFAITWNSNTTQTNWFYSDFVQTIWAKICWVEALFCKFLYFRVSSSDPKCPPATDPASLGERPCVHQWANSFANLRNCKNQGCFITVEKGLINLCHVMTSFYRPRPASELPKLQHLFNYRNCKNK